MSDNTKIGFIGFGNMAQAIADGLLSKNAAAAENIFACAANWEKLCRNTKKRGIVPCRDAAETAVNSDIVILAVKPCMMADVTSTVKSILKDKIVISVAAGYPFEKFEKQIIELDRYVKKGGLLIIHFSQYYFEDTVVSKKYKALGNYNQDDYTSSIFDKNSNLIEEPYSRKSIFIKRED